MYERLFISFSGGETSAYMTKRLVDEGNYKEVAVLFANTGLEHEKTLEFVHKFSERTKIPVTWVEAKVIPEKGRPTESRVVNFFTASRKGEPFEETIEKYGIPCNGYPHCTRELKIRPLHHYIKMVLGWDDYHTAIGIRADEFDRMAGDREEKKFVYPLVEWNVVKPQINSFWKRQPFRLEIKSYEGNCVACWKKSFRKHFTLLEESPEAYDFFRRMEKEHAHTGAGEGPRRFFRGHKSVQDLERMKDSDEWQKAQDDSEIYDLFDASYGCSESCEIY